LRVITHSDFDGLCCGILLSEIFKTDHILITEPSEIRNGKIQLTKEDIIADLPIPPMEVHMAFDHHSSSSKKLIKGDWFIIDPNAPSCARLIYEEYKSKYSKIKVWKNMINFCDKIDSGNLTLKEYETENEYTKVSLTLKSFDKGLDKFYIRYLIKKLLKFKSFDKINKLDWVVERYKYKVDSMKKWKKVIERYMRYEDKILITDIRNATEFIPKGNYFEAYKMYPESLVSLHIASNARGETFISLSGNIFNKKNKVHLGNIAMKYNGGGHKGAAGFSVETTKADEILKKVIKEIKNGNKS